VEKFYALGDVSGCVLSGCVLTGPSRYDILYRQAIGSLIFIANITRPDIAFIVNYLSRFVSSYNEQHWQAVKNVFCYLKGTIEMGIL